ncbi:pheophytinase [Populus alba x Populus x berolinensis]|uniref:Pheophytinase n=1 Tax=Populus alba x Populus x berolinensis TaxID=444605 RepID=A0AAD6RPT3_9ROSI|nr:pheophytinase [Populus alba x Populus x berolinensis]
MPPPSSLLLQLCIDLLQLTNVIKFFPSWQKISDPKSIAQIIKHVYTDHYTNIDKVLSRILEITQHPAAAASFASIMFAPQGQLSFRLICVSRCKMSRIPICLMYGKENP